jgi:hypothetical protein
MLNYGSIMLTINPVFSIAHAQVVVEVALDNWCNHAKKDIFSDSDRPETQQYEMLQFNSRNGPVKAKVAYLCTSSCHLWNALLVKQWTLWDSGATARYSFENPFPEYLTVTSHCVWCLEYQHIFVPSGHFLILERAKNFKGLSQVNKVNGHVCNVCLMQELSNS